MQAEKWSSIELLVINELLCMGKLTNICEINLQAWNNNLPSLELCNNRWRKKTSRE